MFNFKEFLTKGLVDGVKTGQTRYTLTMRAAGLIERGMLDTGDLEPLSDALDERDRIEQEKAAQEAVDEGFTVSPDLEEGTATETEEAEASE